MSLMLMSVDRLMIYYLALANTVFLAEVMNGTSGVKKGP